MQAYTHTKKKKIRNLESSQLWLHMSVMLVLGSCDKTLHLLASFSYAGRCYFKIKTWTRAAGHPLKARLITQTSKKKKANPKPNKPNFSPKIPQINKYRIEWASVTPPCSCEVMSTSPAPALPPILKSFPLIPCMAPWVYLRNLLCIYKCWCIHFFLLKHWFLLMFIYFPLSNFFVDWS